MGDFWLVGRTAGAGVPLPGGRPGGGGRAGGAAVRRRPRGVPPAARNHRRGMAGVSATQVVLHWLVDPVRRAAGGQGGRAFGWGVPPGAARTFGCRGGFPRRAVRRCQWLARKCRHSCGFGGAPARGCRAPRVWIAAQAQQSTRLDSALCLWRPLKCSPWGDLVKTPENFSDDPESSRNDLEKSGTDPGQCRKGFEKWQALWRALASTR